LGRQGFAIRAEPIYINSRLLIDLNDETMTTPIAKQNPMVSPARVGVRLNTLLLSALLLLRP
jgi:hypothetical protein